MSSTSILFMAHYLNESILREVQSLQASCSPVFDVTMLYDNSKKDFDPSSFRDTSDFYLYDVQDVANNYTFMNESRRTILPGNCIFPILLFVRDHPDVRYIWRVEYDVRFGGDWSFFFNHFVNNESDLLGTTIFRYDFRPEWNWWKSLKAPGGSFDKKWLLRGFLPVFRLSQKACVILNNAYNAGWSGHYEVSIPTILNYHGCLIEDIGGDGEFVKPENRNRFYTNTPSAPGLAPGTFVCPPNNCNYSTDSNRLYHPVKE
jgi:hypothetical protein